MPGSVEMPPAESGGCSLQPARQRWVGIGAIWLLVVIGIALRATARGGAGSGRAGRR
jgi:hypothetical protein